MKNSVFFNIAVLIIASYFFFSGLFYMQGILVPILFAALLSMLILPLCRRMEKKINSGISVLLCLLLIVATVSGLIFLIYSQVVVLADDLPLFREKALEKFHALQVFIDATFHVPAGKQMAWLQGNYSKMMEVGGNFLKSFLLGLTGGLANFLLVVIYIFFFLILRHRIKNFILQLFPEENHKKVGDILNKIQGLTLHYMLGLLMEILVLGALNSVGFLILGIKQAIFWGYLGAVLNLIPYIGAIIGTVFPILIALVYKDSIWYALGVVGVIVVTQFIDNNFLTPKVVASHIRVNALATIIVIIIGGALWGLAGMILFLPLLGIVKIVSDNVDPLKPLGYLIGEDEQEAKKIEMKK